MNKPVIILGAGGHAKVLIDGLRASAVEIIGLTDPSAALHGQTLLGVPVLGADDELANYSPGQVRLVNGLGSVAVPQARMRLYERGKAMGYAFASVIHPAAYVSSDAVLGEGVQVMAGAVLQPGVLLGDNVVINTGASVDHDAQIGCHTHIAPGATLAGEVCVGQCVHIGMGTSVIQRVEIGDFCLVGAGSLVIRDVPAEGKVFGSPAKVVD